MFDLGWAEILLIMVVAVLVIGPKEIPTLMHTLGKIMRRLRYIRYAFSQQFDEFLQENDIDDLRKSVNFEARHFDEDKEDEAYIEPKEEPKDGTRH